MHHESFALLDSEPKGFFRLIPCRVEQVHSKVFQEQIVTVLKSKWEWALIHTQASFIACYNYLFFIEIEGSLMQSLIQLIGTIHSPSQKVEFNVSFNHKHTWGDDDKQTIKMTLLNSFIFSHYNAINSPKPMHSGSQSVSGFRSNWNVWHLCFLPKAHFSRRSQWKLRYWRRGSTNIEDITPKSWASFTNLEFIQTLWFAIMNHRISLTITIHHSMACPKVGTIPNKWNWALT